MENAQGNIYYVFMLSCLTLFYTKAQKHSSFHVFSPFSASFYPPSQKGSITGPTKR